MATAKDIVLKPITAQDANTLVKRLHYSGKVVNNSQLHIGVFLGGRLEGAMQFGPSLDKRKIQGLVAGTLWHEFIELNRMAFSDRLPRNSESRALSIAMKLLRKHAPQIKWVVTFADGTQCGDGTIYRAAGFVLTGIKENNQIWEAPSGNVYQSNSARGVSNCNIVKARAMQEVKEYHEKNTISRVSVTKAQNILDTGASSMKVFIDAGWKPKPGYQLRYIYFIDPAYRERLTVPELPYSEIERRGARMYRGEKLDAPPVNGDNRVTNAAGRFDSDPEAL